MKCNFRNSIIILFIALQLPEEYVGWPIYREGGSDTRTTRNFLSSYGIYWTFILGFSFVFTAIKAYGVWVVLHFFSPLLSLPARFTSVYNFWPDLYWNEANIFKNCASIQYSCSIWRIGQNFKICSHLLFFCFVVEGNEEGSIS